MEIINSILTWMMKKRVHEVELFVKYPIEVQQELFIRLLQTAKNTEFGLKYDFDSISRLEQYQERVPVRDYTTMYPYIEQVMRGKQNVIWPTQISWFAKSSGTTSSRSKFIPVSKEALEECHFKGGKDLLAIYINNFPDTKLFSGKSLVIGGSQQVNKMDQNENSYYGDVSAVLMKNMPFYGQFLRTPKLEVALMDDWEKKIELMAQETSAENVTSLVGVPTWTVILMRRIVEMKGVDNILDIWPSLELFIHGAVSFIPYRELFKQLIPSPNMRYMETYNASEGFFGIQDQPDSDDMLLMLDYGVYYEFIAMDEVHKENPIAVGLEDVELGKNYAVVISTNAGLWRYNIGDTIKFTSLSPFRFKISGRTKHFINAFGEEVIVENAEFAIAKACEATESVLEDFTAAPKYFGTNTSGCHEWIIEFRKSPNSQEEFVKVLDATLRKINSDYDAKRQKDIALQMPIVHWAPTNTFYDWMKMRGKLGGQNKVPRLANSREYIDEILKMINE
jgi:hypothetical protein